MWEEYTVTETYSVPADAPPTGAPILPLLLFCSALAGRVADLRGAQLQGLRIVDGSWKDVDLRNADLSFSTLDSVEMHNVDLREAQMRCCTLHRWVLRLVPSMRVQADLRLADFSGSTILNSRTSTWGRHLLPAQGACFDNCVIRGSDGNAADLTGATGENACCTESDWFGRWME